jgi:aldose 1-epimerase
MTISAYGRTETGVEVHQVSLGGPALRVRILTFGAVIERLEAPDHAGQWANLVLGLDSLEGYVQRSPHFGAVPGRFANRIAGGRFTLDGVEYHLACNNGPNALHGGPTGFGKRIWAIEDSSDRHVTLGYTSADGEEGYPGTLHAKVTYSLDGPELRLDYWAQTDRPTVLNLTNHSYFNLGGEGGGSVLGHVLQVEADAFLPVDATSIPTGEIRSVVGTPFDFRAPVPVGSRIRQADEQLQHGIGYDHTWVLRPGPGVRPAVRLNHPPSGRMLEVLTTEPGVQVYSGNQLTGSLTGPSGRSYRQGDAICFETQHFPDSPNQPAFPSTTLRPGETFNSTTIFRLTALPGC